MKTYPISGLKCQGCVKTVTETLSQVLGVKSVTVDFDQALVTVQGLAPTVLLKRALKGSKFQLGKPLND